MPNLKEMKALHLYTGEGYGLVTSSMLNKLYGRNLDTFVVHLGDQNVRFDYQQSTSDRTRVINQSINDLKAFLPEWAASKLSRKQMFVSVPLLHNNTSTIENADAFYSNFRDYMKQVKDAVINALGQRFWDNDFCGFYFRTEAVYPLQEKISRSNPTSTPMVKLMNDISYLVRNTYEKQFMWCPYYGYGTYKDNIIYNLGLVANRTNIFDIICIQPAYYFQGSAYKGNLRLVFDSINDDPQEVVDADRNPVAGGRIDSATAIVGVNMEANDYFNTSKKTEFDAYIDAFMDIVDMGPIVWYAGGIRNLVQNSQLLDAIEDFLM
ncbi:hypothetical protein EDM52_23880 [Brevibacillus invocatus]|uniref:Hyaluronidase n=1 Tax=Brevibacillus invocatus TaxID=173959 RepID=A0A3M8BPQ0_9BACL|nr:hypothetical protein [Brevibacillus invocatus]RNB65037.1 hypothetical protein EDM52_23880 [Brevibacillus invocatus]